MNVFACMPKEKNDRWWALALCLLLSAYAVVFLMQKTIILADYPDWVYQGVILHEKLISASALPQYSLKAYPVPNSFVTLIVGALTTCIDPLATSKIVIVAYLSLFAIILCKASGAMASNSGAAKAFILFPAAVVATPFWWGSLNYQWALLFLTLYLYLDSKDRLSSLGLILLSVVVFLSHAIVFILLFAHVALKSILMKRYKRLIALAPSAILSCWYAVGRFLIGSNTEQIHLATDFKLTLKNVLFYKVHMVLKRGPFQNLLAPDGNSFLADYAWLFWILLALSLLYLMLMGIQIIGCLPSRMRSAAFAEKFDIGFFIAVGLASLLMPIRFLGVADFGQRLLILSLLGLALRTPFSRRASQWLCGIVVIISLPALLFLSAYASQRLHPHEKPDRSALVNNLLDVPVFARAYYYERFSSRDFNLPIFPSGMLQQQSRSSQNEARIQLSTLKSE